MPIPGSSLTLKRASLRDRVYDELLSAIQDGTLQPGERLHDDPLTAWFGVSRTPIREAITKLAIDGLIEMKPNRYTRVTALSADNFMHASQLLQGLHRVVLDNLPPRTAIASVGYLDSVSLLVPRFAERDPAAVRSLVVLLGHMTALTNNPLLIEAERVARTQVMFHLSASGVSIDWMGFRESANRIIEVLP